MLTLGSLRAWLHHVRYWVKRDHPTGPGISLYDTAVPPFCLYCHIQVQDHAQFCSPQHQQRYEHFMNRNRV